jgi:hypothetical protein
MEVTLGKILGLVTAIGFVVAAIVIDGGFTMDVLKGCIILLFPLVLIWFPEELGSFTGNIGRGGNISTETPAFLISIAGWFFLLAIPVLAYLSH